MMPISSSMAASNYVERLFLKSWHSSMKSDTVKIRDVS